MMSVQEVETAVRNDIPLVAVVFNDSSLGAEYHDLGAKGGPAEVAPMDAPEISDVVKALGADGYTVISVAEIRELEDELTRPDGPVVVECIVDPPVRHRSFG
jgi:acetolactate synthase-1/2/3 large subunit